MISFAKPAAAMALAVMVAANTTTCSEAESATTDIIAEADNFKMVREFTAWNTRTDRKTFHLIANFSVNMDSADNQAEFVCKTGEDEYQRVLLHLNDDLIYSVTNFDESDDMGMYTFQLEDFESCAELVED